MNASTDKESTLYYAKVDARHWELALDVISDIYLNSKLEKAEIERERGVIIQEINMYEDMPMLIAESLFEELLYGDQPAGWRILGTKKNIERITRNDFLRYLNKNYSAHNTVISIAGSIVEKLVEKKVEKFFSKISTRKPAGKRKVIEKQNRPEIKIKEKETDQTHLIVGFRAFSFGHPQRYILAILSNILGGSMSSRLFLSVRERHGLAYYISSFIEAYTDSGYFAAKAGVDTDSKKIEKSLKIILSEFKKIRERKVSRAELQKAKDYFRGKLALNLETSEEVAAHFITYELMGYKPLTPEEILEKIDKVTPDDIIKVARKIIRPQSANLAVVGPKIDALRLSRIMNEI